MVWSTFIEAEKEANHLNSVIHKTNYLINAFVKTKEMLTSFMQATNERLSNVFKSVKCNHELPISAYS